MNRPGISAGSIKPRPIQYDQQAGAALPPVVRLHGPVTRSVARGHPRLPLDRRCFERANRRRQPDHREDPPHRPRLPQLQQLRRRLLLGCGIQWVTVTTYRIRSATQLPPLSLEPHPSVGAGVVESSVRSSLDDGGAALVMKARRLPRWKAHESVDHARCLIRRPRPSTTHEQRCDRSPCRRADEF